MKSHLEGVNDAKMHGLIARLQRYELDFEERLAKRKDALRDPDVPAIDPLYKRLFFTLRGLKQQRVGVERELARRVVPS